MLKDADKEWKELIEFELACPASPIDMFAKHCKELREALKYYVNEDHWDSVSGDDCYVPHVFVAAGKNTDPCEVGDSVLNKRPGDYEDAK